MSRRHETNHKYSSGVILSRNTYRKIDSNACEKKTRSCPFSSGTARRKRAKKSFSSDWTEKLAESDKGPYFDQEQWLKELNEQPSAKCDSSVSSSTCSASRSKITVEEPLADLESTETWQKIYGHAIVAGQRLQELEKMTESVSCCISPVKRQLLLQDDPSLVNINTAD